MKRVVTVLISCMVMVALSACNGGNNNDNGNGNGNNNNNNKASEPAASSKATEQPANSSDQSSPNGNAKADPLPQGLEPLDDKPKTIVVSILGVTPFYKLAKEKYEKLHPNVTVQFKEFTSESMLSASESEKYVKSTTTAVLSGKGADLFALRPGELPIDKFENKGALENLDDWMKRDAGFDPRQYQMNVMEGSETNGGLYMMPVEFYLEALFGDADGLEQAGIQFDDRNWTWNQFNELSKQLTAKNGTTYSLNFLPPENMMNDLVSDNYDRLIDGASGKASFDSPFFNELLTGVKQSYDAKELSGDTAQFRKSLLSYSFMTSPSDYLVRLASYFKHGKVYQKPHAADEESGISFLVTSQIAMNANSKVKRDAWEFMKFLLSEEAQSYPRQSGFSMNKAVNEKAIADIKEKGVDKDAAAKSEGAAVEVTDEKLEALRDMLSEANLRDRGYESTTIQQIIAEEVKAFFAGQKSADSVARLIQNRVTTYLNE
ncbi:extracellular solute-binding protein [Paenibacillus rhizovicinus]|uniref:Extracellular solute-binding protein n=1 Tax=Paenibacillus rhizovicinus TaxID=2704463 RepID=A0A6C0PAB3_9BACL|nr:extracellular solute-binding protein [Paenibacillus rhizovicinus]QHW34583.1 extracellular solute-binding protein [Paenibacillus rhizovicinus]